MEYDCEVIVLGAGPSGSVTAHEIAKAGCNVVLVEKDRFAGETNICGGVAPTKIENEFKIPDSVVDKRIKRMACYFPGKIVAQDTESISFRRSIFDRYLAESAVKNGARMLPSTLAMDVERHKESISVKLRNRKDGSMFDLRGKMVVFADGPSTGSTKFGIGFTRDADKTALGAVYEIEHTNNRLDWLEFYFDRTIAPWGYGWIFPKKDMLNVGVGSLMSALSNSKPAKNIHRCLDILVSKHPIAAEKLHDRRILNFKAGIIPNCLARKVSGERILAVGDAAGMVVPIWGGGIEFGMRSGLLAAKWAIKAVENDRFDESFLMNYQKEWRQSDDYKWLKKTYWFSRLFLFCSRLNGNSLFHMYSFMLRRAHAYNVDEDTFQWSNDD